MKRTRLILIAIGCVIGFPLGYFVLGPMTVNEPKPSYPIHIVDREQHDVVERQPRNDTLFLFTPSQWNLGDLVIIENGEMRAATPREEYLIFKCKYLVFDSVIIVMDKHHYAYYTK